MLDCDDQYCSVHKDEIVDLYKSVVNACITARLWEGYIEVVERLHRGCRKVT